jgi:phosphoserine phosphatase RsbU/P
METMETRGITEGLVEKRRNLAVWLETAPAEDKDLHLGPASEEAVHRHLHVLDEAVVRAGQGALGLCKICGEPVDEELLEMDYTACVCLSHLTEEEARPLERELELSRMVQRALLPQEAPAVPGMELAAFLRPAQIVGGDFFDFQRFEDGKYGIAIADVVGKGVSASLIMASMQTAMRALVPENDHPEAVLTRINGLFTHNAYFTTFVTLFLGAYDASAHTLIYSNAGHNPPILFRTGDHRNGSLIYLHPTAPAIGLLEDPPFREQSIRLQPGDCLLLYTDGVPEAFNDQDEQYGMERLENFVRCNANASPKDLIRALQRELTEFTHGEPLADDVTIISGRLTA